MIRRTLLTRSLQAGAGIFLASSATNSRAAGGIRLLETKVISRQPQFYHGWPTVARRRDGTLWVVWSGGREAHVCPFGQVCAMSSGDDGATWTRPRVLHDGPLDDRDAGILETPAGALLATSFTSLAYAPGLEKELSASPDQRRMSAVSLAEWKATRDFLTPHQRRAGLGEWAYRSQDGGGTWSAAIPTLVNSPHGPIALRDGRLLYAGKQLWTPDQKIGVAESTDDGLSWHWLADIPTRPGDEALHGYHELHAVETADGSVVIHIRNHNPGDTGETLQCESTDGGKSWTVPHSIGVWGLPSHLLRLREGQLLMTYGHRRAPFGIQARVSPDQGRSWGPALMISVDGIGGDLGYPSTVELADGSLLSVWYETMREPAKAVLRQARWILADV